MLFFLLQPLKYYITYYITYITYYVLHYMVRKYYILILYFTVTVNGEKYYMYSYYGVQIKKTIT